MYIRVRVTAGAKKESLVRKAKDHFLASVREPAERNLANGRVIELLAASFSVPKGKVRIISGHHSPGKILSIETGDGESIKNEIFLNKKCITKRIQGSCLYRFFAIMERKHNRIEEVSAYRRALLVTLSLS